MGKITYFIKKKIGNETHSFSVEGENLHEVVMAAGKLSFGDIDLCGICGHNDLILAAHVTPNEGHEYTYVRCKKCKATLNFGQQKKDNNTYYYKTVDMIGGQPGQKAYAWKPYVKNSN